MVGRFKLKEINKFNSDNFSELSPEVLKMLEEMSEKKKLTSGSKNEIDDDVINGTKFNSDAKTEAAATKPLIDLGDKEFGKY